MDEKTEHIAAVISTRVLDNTEALSLAIKTANKHCNPASVDLGQDLQGGRGEQKGKVDGSIKREG